MMKSYSFFALLLPAILVLLGCSAEKRSDTDALQPNVLLIFTDQQNIEMMSAMGNPYLSTPNMDRLAERGVLFKNAYCTSPVCGPARSSIITGMMPHQTGVEWNGDSIRAEVRNAGEIFREAGYTTTWAGKWHLPESYPQRAKAKYRHPRGFDLLPFRDPEIENWMLGAETDPPLTKAVVNYLEQYDDDAPFFLAVSYHNPHDICFYARKDGWVSEADSTLEIRYYGFEYQLPEVIGTHPGQFELLPPLPHNHEANEQEPDFILDKRLHHQEYGMETKLAFEEFQELEWRAYLNAYYRLTEMVDAEIGKVMDALERKELDENTIIVFTSDHGDGAAAHKWSAKLSLYQESTMVPMLVSFPGQIPSRQINGQHLVSQIDILPTLCDYAGIKPDISFTGQSMRPIIEDATADWRNYLVVELADFKPDKKRKGRMLRSEKYKYNIYTTGARNEQLFDLENDPGEMYNLAFEVEFMEVKEAHREYLKTWIERTGDTFRIASE